MNPSDYPVCLTIPKRLTSYSSWIGHIPFAMLLVDALRPTGIVELGSYTGESFCAFCQAVKELKLNTRTYAIDTWKGDHQTLFYDSFIMEDLLEHCNLYYKDSALLIQRTFDEALPLFENSSVELLHIDGLHTYEAVKHDFETWLPKMSAKGVILFHDTNVKVKDFGVWKFWDEIKNKYPSFSFEHSAGLGIIACGKDVPPFIKNLASLSSAETEKIRLFFSKLGDNLSNHITRKAELLEKAVSSIQNISETSCELYIMSGKIMLAQGELETARREFFKALRITPDNTEACILMTDVLIALGLNEDAEKYLSKTVEANHEDILLKKRLAGMYHEKQKFHEARKIYEAILEKNIDDIDTLMPLTDIFCQLGDVANARKTCEKILSFTPDNNEAKKILTLLQAMR